MIMKKNMGSTDKLVRFLLAILVAVLYFSGIINGTLAVILGILAVVFLLTSLVSFCPLYVPFGITTRRKP